MQEYPLLHLYLKFFFTWTDSFKKRYDYIADIGLI